MKMQSVTSSAIESIGHDPETKRLRIKFQSGHTHDFPNVTAEQYQAFLAAPSIGKHFHAHFRGKESSRVKD